MQLTHPDIPLTEAYQILGWLMPHSDTKLSDQGAHGRMSSYRYLSNEQCQILRRLGIKLDGSETFFQGHQFIVFNDERRHKGLGTLRQVKALIALGYDDVLSRRMTFKDAAAIIRENRPPAIVNHEAV